MKRNEKLEILKGQKLFIKNDIIVFIILFIIIAIMFFSVFIFNEQSNGNVAYIYSDNKLIKTMPLNINDEYIYEINGEYNKIVVKNRYIYIEDTDCKDKICKRSGKISSNLESIICLPHKLKIEVKEK